MSPGKKKSKKSKKTRSRSRCVRSENGHQDLESLLRQENVLTQPRIEIGDIVQAPLPERRPVRDGVNGQGHELSSVAPPPQAEEVNDLNQPAANGYGAPTHDNGYGAPAHNNGYGAPAHNNGYGAPAHNNGYGATTHDHGYGAPTHDNALEFNGTNLFPFPDPILDQSGFNVFNGSQGGAEAVDMFDDSLFDFGGGGGDIMSTYSSGSEWEVTHGGARPANLNNKKRKGQGQSHFASNQDAAGHTQPCQDQPRVAPPRVEATPSPSTGTSAIPGGTIRYTAYYNPTSFAAISYLANVCGQFPAFQIHLQHLKLLHNCFQRCYVRTTNGKSRHDGTPQLRARELEGQIKKAVQATNGKRLRIRICDEDEIIPN